MKNPSRSGLFRGPPIEWPVLTEDTDGRRPARPAQSPPRPTRRPLRSASAAGPARSREGSRCVCIPGTSPRRGRGKGRAGRRVVTLGRSISALNRQMVPGVPTTSLGGSPRARADSSRPPSDLGASEGIRDPSPGEATRAIVDSTGVDRQDRLDLDYLPERTDGEGSEEPDPESPHDFENVEQCQPARGVPGHQQPAFGKEQDRRYGEEHVQDDQDGGSRRGVASLERGVAGPWDLCPRSTWSGRLTASADEARLRILRVPSEPERAVRR